MAKAIRFLSIGYELQSHYHRKNINWANLKIRTNLKFTNLSQKSKVYGNNCSKGKSDISLSHTRQSRLAEYMILWVVVCGNAPVLQKAGTTRGIQCLLNFTLQHGWPSITLKNIKKYFHDALKGINLLRIIK